LIVPLSGHVLDKYQAQHYIDSNIHERDPMQRSVILLLLLALFAAIPLVSQTANDPSAVSSAPIFDPAANPAKDFDSAIVIAKASNKRILLDVGGEWCKWCHFLDKFFETNQDVADFLHSNFVVVKVNFSKENKNEAFLSRYPEVAGYPHFFVLESDGTFLHSQDTGALENGSKVNPGHDHDKVLAFLKAWAKPAK
jgi:thiol:disulfide interchange protein